VESEALAPSPPAGPRRRLLPLGVLVAGGVLAVVLGSRVPRDQHVRFVLGGRSGDVTALEVQYVTEEGEVARETRMTFEPGRAPRIVAHDPSMPDGAYRLRIDLDTSQGRRSAERQVKLGSGTTSVDLSRVLETPK
jgi:hypothetical protein